MICATGDDETEDNSGKTQEANAELIVKSVNERAEIVKALDDAVFLIDVWSAVYPISPKVGDASHDMLTRIQATLAKAKGEA